MNKVSLYRVTKKRKSHILKKRLQKDRLQQWET